MEERLYLSGIYDLYGAMLTERQKKAFELHHLDDFSLQEISEQLGITRQAVNDLLKRTENLLRGYENKLRFYEQSQNEATCLQRLSDYLLSIHGVCFSSKEADEILKLIKKTE